MAADPWEQKLERLAQGDPPRAVDLFAGCGGLSLGLEAAGYHILAALDVDPGAVATYARNLPGVAAVCADIRHVTPAAFATEAGLQGPVDALVDVVAGSPPCQAFSRIGRAKLAAACGQPDAFLSDPRASLVHHFVAYVRSLKPLAFVMENVPDLLDYGGRNMAEAVCESLARDGYVSRYALMNASAYGVPQHRLRTVIVGVHAACGVVPGFALPTHAADVPDGYRNWMAWAGRKAAGSTRFLALPEGGPAPAVGARAALADLPILDWHLAGSPSRGRPAPTDLLPYSAPAEAGTFAHRMRAWSGHAAPDGTDGHVFRRTPRDYRWFAAMPPGSQYPDMLALARQVVAAGQASPDEVPPYPEDRFPNRWWKLDPDRPARTLTAHLGRDSYTHIHYDDRQARTVTVREAARLQSFPDGFRFPASINHAMTQIGNAVPPLLATAIAEALGALLATAAGRRPAAEVFHA